MSEELELKYSIDDPRSVRLWLDATFPPVFPPNPDERWRLFSIVDLYFDTADGALAAAGYGARLRRTRRRTTLTLKSDIEVTAALHRRDEIEAPATQELDISRWPPSPARDLLASVVAGRRLVENFVVRQRRRERHVSTGGAVLLASIDSGDVLAAGAAAGEIAQLEIERISGRRAVMTRVARSIEGSGLARPESRSKLAIAQEIATEAGRVNANDLVVEAGRKVLRRHLLRLLERETSMRAGDELALKQMRVATRRMRATLRVFGDAYKKRWRRPFTGELGRVGDALGAVRDLDVLIATVERPRALRPVADYWRARRDTAFSEALAVLDSDGYDRLVRESLAFTSTRGEGAVRRRAKATLATTAPAALRTAFEQLIEAGAAAVTSDEDAAWHALRIEGRRFRYSIEAFGDVLNPEPKAEILLRVTRLQDHLGGMNDAALGSEAVADWLTESGATVTDTTATETTGSDATVADTTVTDATDATATDTTVTDGTRSAARKYIDDRHRTVTELRASFQPVWDGISDAETGALLDQALAALTQS